MSPTVNGPERIRCQGDDGLGCYIPHADCRACDNTGTVPWYVPCKWPSCGCYAEGCCGVADA